MATCAATRLGSAYTVNSSAPSLLPIIAVAASFHLTFSLNCPTHNSFLHPVAMSAPFQKIAVQNPVVELDGDEMTRIIWKKIREEVRCCPVLNVSSILIPSPS